MAAHVLLACGLDPGYLIGGELTTTGTNAAWGTGEWLVVEADESDRSLLAIDADVAVVTQRRARPRRPLRVAGRAAGRLPDVPGRGGRADRRSGARGAGGRGRPDVRRRGPRADARGLALHGRRGGGGPVGPGRAQRGQRGGGAGRLRAGGRRSAAGRRGAGGLPRRRPALPGPRPHGVGRPGDRRLRPPSDRGPGDDRGRADAGRAARRGRLPAAPVLAHRASSPASSAPRWRRPTSPACSAIYPARERAEDFPGVTGLLVAEAAADRAGGRPVLWLPALRRRRAGPARPAARRRPLPRARRRRRRRARPPPRHLTAASTARLRPLGTSSEPLSPPCGPKCALDAEEGRIRASRGRRAPARA